MLKKLRHTCLGLWLIVSFIVIQIHSQTGFAFSWFSRSDQAANIWDSMQAHFELLPSHYPVAMQNQIRAFLGDRSYLNELVNNASPYIYFIYEQAQLRHMPAEIALLPMVESDYNPFAYSRAGATGLWQIMPGTASGFGLSMNWWYDGRRDIVTSTKAALDYLNYLHGYFNNDWLLAIAAYDSGEGAVQAAIKRNQRLHRPTDFWSLALPHETQLYIPKLLALTAILAAPKHYGAPIKPIPNQPYFSTLEINQQININQAAKLAHLDPKSLRKLNPGFRRWATSPTEPYLFVLPTAKTSPFLQALEQQKSSHPATWQHHRVIRGETLSQIAKGAHTTTTVLRQINKLHQNAIHAGEDLLIPTTPTESAKHFHREVQHGTIAEEHLPGPQRLTHRVQVGETLSSIAKQYAVGTQEIIFWNPSLHQQTLKPGKRLTLWIKHSHTANHSSAAYQVKRGDTLSTIAKRYHTRTQRLVQANALKSTRLQIGQLLRVST